MSRQRKIILTAGASLLLIGAYYFVNSRNATPETNLFDKPVLITAGPAGLVGGTPPDATRSMWQLARTSSGANLQRVKVITGKVTGIIPIPKESMVVTESTGGVLGIGLRGQNAGAVHLLSATSGETLSSVPVSGPVLDLVSGADGVTMYALTATKTARVVDVIDLKGRVVVSHIPVSMQSVSIAVSPDQAALYILEPSGHILMIDVATSRVTDNFNVEPDGRHISATLDGTKLLLLKGPLNSSNVAVIDVITQRTVGVIAAPANTVWITTSLDSRQVIDLVGTPTIGNVQTFLIP